MFDSLAGVSLRILTLSPFDAAIEMRDHRYHVVCRDCPTELLSDSERTANRVAAGHENAAGHDVAIGRVE
ncbi:hypothetical protein ACFQFH_09155 [Halobaculum halobium]|uniref:Uncharacterized protein n=1 Tax=Halobaculum halobium TaxID=3032281 RepID=A0ABD5T9W9_9EURY|nr:hypothetical protein [Halobaculum sp. SYNS20]